MLSSKLFPGLKATLPAWMTKEEQANSVPGVEKMGKSKLPLAFY